jgi:glycosyltransferase involved in cell wall biosynthesis
MVEMPKQLPFISVVVICYNGEKTLGATLTSLMKQTYPKDRFEVIVVNDGSADNSAAVAKQYPLVRYIEFKKNRGIPAARNAGLEIARGTIYAAFDCDCKADPDWLTALVKGYADGKAMGVGARLVEPEPITRLATRYISLCDSLFAPVSDDDVRKSTLPHHRFLNYLTTRLHPPVIDNQIRKVPELYGAIGSFPMDILRAVNGWDETMNGIEDRDLCQRMRSAFPDKPFYLVPDAMIVHERGESLRQYLSRPVKRGIVNFAFHHRNKIAPPIFPFPLLYVAACLVSLMISMPAALLLVVCLPQLLYFWWPYKSFQRRQKVLLLFPYIQLLEEAMVIIGLIKGWITFSRRRRHA